MADRHAAHDLRIFIDNDGDLYRQQTTSILKNLATKKAQGKYQHDLAVKLFGYLVEAGAKKYAKMFGTPSSYPWYKMFDVATRKLVAEELTRAFEVEYALGNYDFLLPKKYQPQEKVKGTTSRQARRTPAGDHATIRHDGQPNGWEVRDAYAPPKSPAQLEREIKHALSSYRRGKK